MSETSNRITSAGRYLRFDEQTVCFAVNTQDGRPILDVDLTNLAKLNAALTQPVPCGVLTEGERAFLQKMATYEEDAARLYRNAGHQVTADRCQKKFELLNNLLARSAQQGEEDRGKK